MHHESSDSFKMPLFMPQQFHWLQVDLSFHTELPDAFFWKDLAGLLQELSVSSRFDLCFFSRKPPGIRLRFLGSFAFARLLPSLYVWLGMEMSSKRISSFSFAQYEPETHRFGGVAGLEIAHLGFDYDTRTVLRYESGTSIREFLPRSVLSIVTFRALCSLALEDAAEEWDVFKSIDTLAANSGVQAPAEDEVKKTFEEIILSRGGLLANPKLAALLGECQSSREHLALCINAAAKSGLLSIGIREWLVSFGIFHFNRLGIMERDLRVLLHAILRLYETAGEQQKNEC